MSAKSKKQETETAETTDTREVYLREGRTLTVEPHAEGEVLEIRSSSGQVELRIKLTEQGPVLQMESARLELKATESVEIESKHVAIKATEKLTLESEDEVSIDAEGAVRVNGKMIYLN